MIEIQKPCPIGKEMTNPYKYAKLFLMMLSIFVFLFVIFMTWTPNYFENNDGSADTRSILICVAVIVVIIFFLRYMITGKCI